MTQNVSPFSLRGALLATVFCGFAGSAWAIPSLTPHPHDNPATVDKNTTWIKEPPADPVADPDPDAPNATMHQHRDRDALDNSNGHNKYLGYSVWDNRSYRTGAHFGHGYIEPTAQARYLFEADFPELGKTDFNNAVDEWEIKTNGNGTNVNGVGINISMLFEEVASGDHEIDVKWDDIGAADMFALAFWAPGATDFTFDSAPTRRLNANAGENVRPDGGGACGLFIRFDWEWHFGGAGAPPNVSRDYDICQDTDGNGFIDTFVDATFTRPAYDFYTIALHEIGHAFGLDHIGTGIMREDIAGFVIRDPDAGALDGTKDLYAIPRVPEPAMAGLFGLALAGMWRLRRRPSGGA